MLPADRKKLIERITKLLALAEGSGFTEEAASARAKAIELMAEHNIQACKREEGFVELRRESGFASQSDWDYRLCFAIAKLNGVYFLLSGPKHYKFIGRPEDIQAYDYMMDLVDEQQTEAWLSFTRLGKDNSRKEWQLGFAMGVEAKVQALLNAVNQAQAKGQGPGPGQAIILATPLRQAEQWFRAQGGSARQSRVIAQRGYSQEGFQAGTSVSLSKRGAGQSTTLRLGH